MSALNNNTLNNISEIIRRQRQLRGLTQTELAMQIGISLPTIQNLESGRANPSWSIMMAIFDYLDITIDFKTKKFTFDNLIRHGLAMLSDQHLVFDPSSLSQRTLAQEIKFAMSYFKNKNHIKKHQREFQSFCAMLNVLVVHYPEFIEQNFKNEKSWIAQQIFGQDPGQLIKLSRISLQRISQYV